MIHFLHTHPNFLDDLHDAVQLIGQHAPKHSDHAYQISHDLQKVEDELRHFEAVAGWVDPLHTDNVFRLNVGDSKSSWKRWQDNCHAIAAKYDGCLFTQGGIAALVKQMNKKAALFKNGQTIQEPDWAFCWEYNIRPSVGIGEGCTIVFEPVRGYYTMEALENE